MAKRNFKFVAFIGFNTKTKLFLNPTTISGVDMECEGGKPTGCVFVHFGGSNKASVMGPIEAVVKAIEGALNGSR